MLYYELLFILVALSVVTDYDLVSVTYAWISVFIDFTPSKCCILYV